MEAVYMVRNVCQPQSVYLLLEVLVAGVWVFRAQHQVEVQLVPSPLQFLGSGFRRYATCP